MSRDERRKDFDELHGAKRLTPPPPTRGSGDSPTRSKAPSPLLPEELSEPLSLDPVAGRERARKEKDALEERLSRLENCRIGPADEGDGWKPISIPPPIEEPYYPEWYAPPDTSPSGSRGYRAFSINMALWATCAIWVLWWLVGAMTSARWTRTEFQTLLSVVGCTSFALMGTLFVYCVTSARRRG